MKYLNNKFIILIFLIVIFNCFSIFSKYDLKIFTNKKPPLNHFENDLLVFKYKYTYPNIKTVGFYTDADEERRIYFLYELQDAIMPIYIEDSINHDYILCLSDSNACKTFAENENLETEGIYNKIFLFKRKDKK